MNIFDEGIAWFNKERQANAVEFVTLKTAFVEINVLASVIEPESEVNGQGLKVSSDKYVFLIDEAYLAGIDLQRGVHLMRKKEAGVLYEVINDKPIADYNDPNNTTRALAAQKRCF